MISRKLGAMAHNVNEIKVQNIVFLLLNTYKNNWQFLFKLSLRKSG